jgi:uncharacterized protein
MIIDLRELDAPEVHFEFLAKPDLDDESARLPDAVKVNGVARTGAGRIELEGRINGRIESDCARCLSPVINQVELPFHALFVSSDDFGDSSEARLNPDDLDVSVFDGERLDVAETVREQILLSLPEQVLCSVECRGLCAICGANRNFTNCNCSDEEPDPRWSALRNLRF